MDANDLRKKTCEPCRGGIPPMAAERAREVLRAIPGWTLSEDAKRISRRFAFRDFVEALAFVNRVGELAEAEGHHPDIAIHWNRVDLVLYTHKIDGLHENDFVMAAKIGPLADTSA